MKPAWVGRPALRSRMRGSSLVALVAAGALLGSYQASGATLARVRQFGTADIDRANGVVATRAGPIAAGSTLGAFAGHTNAGIADAFVRGFARDGRAVWTDQFGTSGYDEATSIATSHGTVYVAGDTAGALPGKRFEGVRDAFLRAYDRTGHVRWTREFGTPAYDVALGVAVDPTGVYVTGYTQGRFGRQPHRGGDDVFVRKFLANGKASWTREFGSRKSDQGLGIVVGASGIYVAGTTSGSLRGTESRGGKDAFLAHLSASGRVARIAQFGTAQDDFGQSVSAASGHLYVGGWTLGAFPGATSRGSDAFIRAFEDGGRSRWTRQFGTSGAEEGLAVTAGRAGITLAGWTTGAFRGQTSEGGIDGFARTYSPRGGTPSTVQFGTTSYDHAYAVSTSASLVYVAGDTGGVFSGQTAAGGQDAFVVTLT